MKRYQRKRKSVFVVFLLFIVVLSCTFTACSRRHEHKADSAWQYDEIGHWQNCADCEEKLNHSSHDWDEGAVTRIPTAEADGEKTFTCKVCQKTRTEGVPYVAEHTAGEEWVYNGTDGLYHWHICTAPGCSEHIYDKAEHSFVEKSNSDISWKECSVCGAKKEEKATVTFDGMTLISDSSVEVDINGVIHAPPVPSVDGYTFEGWYTSLDFSNENKFDFASLVSRNLTLYAGFFLIEAGHEKTLNGTPTKIIIGITV